MPKNFFDAAQNHGQNGKIKLRRIYPETLFLLRFFWTFAKSDAGAPAAVNL